MEKMTEEKTISSERVYEGRVLNLRVDTVQLDQGKTTRREIVEHRGAVALVPLDAHGNVLLVRQFRKAVEQDLLEIPAGTLESGEDALACAHRELEEETGYRAANVREIGGFYPCPGYSTEYIHVFLATGLTPGAEHGDEDEDIEVESVPFFRALEMIDRGEIRDAKSIIGLLTLKSHMA